MTFRIYTTSQYRRDYRLLKKRGYDMGRLDEVVLRLTQGERLPAVNYDHVLRGQWNGARECHIAPDWVLIYRIDGENLMLILMRTGTHEDAFKS